MQPPYYGTYLLEAKDRSGSRVGVTSAATSEPNTPIGEAQV